MFTANSTIKRVIMSVAFLLILTAAFIGGLMLTPPAPRDSNQRAFQEIYRALLDQHFSQPTAEDLYEGAIRGMIQSLDDPFTAYYSAEEAERFSQSLSESFVGIGVSIENIDERVVIRSVFPDSPAQLAGVQVGDILTHIDGIDYREQTFLETYAALLGEIDTEIIIKVYRVGEPTLIEMSMIRDTIENPSVTYSDAVPINGHMIGYIAIHTFGEETPSLVNEALEILEASTLDGLIIDVRNNGGGYLSSLDQLLDIFLSGTDSELPYYYIETLSKGQWVSTPVYGSDGITKPYDIVILINEYSASAAEVFAAAMHDVGGYSLLGQTTYGKGTVQSQIDLSARDGDVLHITFAKWLTPEGLWIDKSGDNPGVIPTVEIVQNPHFLTASLFLTDETYEYNTTVSHHIRIMQEILSALDPFLDIRQDGYFDLPTEDALKDFQSLNDLSDDGILNALTAKALSEALYAYKNDITHDTQIQAAIALLVGDLDD